MVLLTCPECGGKVSDQATSCPHCGYPISILDLRNNETVISLLHRNNGLNWNNFKIIQKNADKPMFSRHVIWLISTIKELLFVNLNDYLHMYIH